MELASDLADLEMGFIFGKVFQDTAGTYNGVDQISVFLSSHFIIKTIYLILKLTIFVKHFLLDIKISFSYDFLD